MPRILVWWHLLSLDAPTVAVLWCGFLAAAMGVAVPGRMLATLALAVWWLYVLDRMLDGLHGRGNREELRDRHLFYARNRAGFWPLLIAAGGLAGVMVLGPRPVLLPSTERFFAGMGALLTAYCVLIHPLRGRVRFVPKEFVVGAFFAGVPATPVWVRLPVAMHGRLALAAAAFGLLCWLNGVAITRWESAQLRQDGWCFWALAGSCAALALLGLVAGVAPAVCVAVMTSVCLLAALERWSERLSPLALRIAADCALLTPLLARQFLR